jgi:hypothetical protein
MANRRMFSKTITNSSKFLMMPATARDLYFHLGMNADDDGYCEHFTVMKMTGSSPDDLRILAAKGFVHVFDDHVLIILDWEKQNKIQPSRKIESEYKNLYPKPIKCQQNVNKMSTQFSLGKGSIGNKSLNKTSGENEEMKKNYKIDFDSLPYPIVINGNLWKRREFKEFFIKDCKDSPDTRAKLLRDLSNVRTCESCKKPFINNDLAVKVCVRCRRNG